MDKKILNLLYRSLDSELTDHEKQVLEQALNRSAELRREKQRIENIRSQLAASGSQKFQPFFAERIVNQIKARHASVNAPESLFDSLITIFKPVAVAAILVLISFLSYNLKSTENYSLAGALGQEHVKLEQVVDPVYLIEME